MNLAAGVGLLAALAGSAFHPTSPQPQDVSDIYQAALKNLDSQVALASDGTYYVRTGDIPAEWLRDSSVQLRPYLFFASSNANAAAILKSAILRQARSLAINPYANAFKDDYGIWEEKFELDSLCYPILLAWTYWKETGDTSLFTPEVKKGLEAALATMEIEQDHPHRSKYTHPKLSNHPVGYTGMIWTGFRPSDDACIFNFLIPAEMMAVQALHALSELELSVFNDPSAAARCATLASGVREGIEKFGLVQTSNGTVYAYEVDGLGDSNLMDDGNLPNLVSIPYFGYLSSENPTYLSTRAFALSHADPYYYSGIYATGIGSPHTPSGMIWPLALLSEAFTSTSAAERSNMLDMLIASDPGDHLLHESFNPNFPDIYTRPDFGWPNAMYIEYALTILSGKPSLPIAP